jgi:hypothetical protein
MVVLGLVGVAGELLCYVGRGLMRWMLLHLTLCWSLLGPGVSSFVDARHCVGSS